MQRLTENKTKKQFDNAESVFAAFVATVTAFLADEPKTPEVENCYNYELESVVYYTEIKVPETALKAIVRLYNKTSEVEVTIRPCYFNGEIGDPKDLDKAKRILTAFDKFRKDFMGRATGKLFKGETK